MDTSVRWSPLKGARSEDLSAPIAEQGGKIPRGPLLQATDPLFDKGHLIVGLHNGKPHETLP